MGLRLKNTPLNVIDCQYKAKYEHTIKDKSQKVRSTFIHPAEELMEVISLVVVQVLLPGFSVLAAQ